MTGLLYQSYVGPLESYVFDSRNISGRFSTTNEARADCLTVCSRTKYCLFHSNNLPTIVRRFFNIDSVLKVRLGSPSATDSFSLFCAQILHSSLLTHMPSTPITYSSRAHPSVIESTISSLNITHVLQYTGRPSLQQLLCLTFLRHIICTATASSLRSATSSCAASA